MIIFNLLLNPILYFEFFTPSQVDSFNIFTYSSFYIQFIDLCVVQSQSWIDRTHKWWRVGSWEGQIIFQITFIITTVKFREYNYVLSTHFRNITSKTCFKEIYSLSMHNLCFLYRQIQYKIIIDSLNFWLSLCFQVS